MGRLRLLVSVRDGGEALEALLGGADILDVKNPLEGALGANFPWIIREVKGLAPPPIEVSATLGDLPNIPGTASLAALGAVSSGADYVKVGLYGPMDVEGAIKLMRSVSRAVKDYNKACKVIAAGYGDYRATGSLNPAMLPRVASSSDSDGILIDIWRKGEHNLFHYMEEDILSEIIEEAHGQDLIAALAGSLGKGDISRVHGLGADIIGVRRAACKKEGVTYGRVDRGLVQELTASIRSMG